MKHLMTVLSLIALAAAALFYKQVLGIFAGMSVMESLEMIVTFVLHVAVGTIAATVALGLPKIVAPWLRMLRRKQRATRRGRAVVQIKSLEPKQRKLSALELLQVLAPNQKIQKTPVRPPDDRVDLNL